MKLAVVMIHFGSPSTTHACLKNLSGKIKDLPLILINNTPQDISSLTKIVPQTLLINNRTNLGFAKAVNQGIKKALTLGADACLLLNNDLTLTFGSLDQLAKTFLDKKTAGIISPVLHHSGNLYDWGGRYNPWTALVKHRNFAQKPKTVLSVDHVAGAAMLIKKEVVDKIGLFDERFFLYFEDLDYCLRARRAGYTIHINPEVVAEHQTSAGSGLSRRLLYQWRSHLAFVFKYLPAAAYPTAFLADLIFYPLILFKSFILK